MVDLVIPELHDIKNIKEELIVNRKYWLLTLPGILLIALCAFASEKKTYRDSIRQKARYYYMEGVRSQIDGNPSGAYSYFKHSLAIDPGYEEAASAIGGMRLGSSLDTLQTPPEQARSLEMMRPFVDRYPEDYDESMLYAYFAYATGNQGEAIRVFSRTDSLCPERTSTLVNLAKAYMADGQIDSAINALNRYEAIEGHDPNLTIQKVSYQFAKRDTVAAIREATNLVNSRPSDPYYLILKGNIFDMINRRDSAFCYYSLAEKLNPENGGAKLALADYYRNMGDTVLYDEKTYQALMSEDFNLDQKVGLLGEYLQKLLNDSSDTSRGDLLFETLRAQYPHDAQVLDLSARYSAAKGKFGEAIEEIGYAISQSPSDEKFRGQLMSYMIADGRYRDAMAEYSEVKKFNKTPMRSLTLLYANAAQLEKDYAEAISGYADIVHEIAGSLPIDTVFSLKQLPSSVNYDDMLRLSQLYTNIADNYYFSKNYDKAFSAYDNALLLDPGNAMALNNYAYFLTCLGKEPEKAREMSEKSLDGENAENPTFLDTYAWILYKSGNYEDARKYAESAISFSSGMEDAGNEELYMHYGEILMALGEKKKALDAFETCLRLSPDNNEIKDKIRRLKHEIK